MISRYDLDKEHLTLPAVFWYVCMRAHILRMCFTQSSFPFQPSRQVCLHADDLDGQHTQSTLPPRSKSPKYSVSQPHNESPSFETVMDLVFRIWLSSYIGREFLLDLDQCIHLLRCFFWRFDVNKNMCDMSECQSIFQCNALKTDQFVWKEVVSLRAINIMVRRIFWCILNKQTSQF